MTKAVNPRPSVIPTAVDLDRFPIARAPVDSLRERLQQAGHKVVYQEFLDAYPPNLRMHLYPKTGAMDFEEAKRWTIELVWGDPDPDRLFARRWTSEGLGEMHEMGSVPAVDVDELWIREQFTTFVRDALDLA